MDEGKEFNHLRITLGFAAEHYGYEVVPAYASNVTITSLANTVHEVRPGSLFIANSRVDRRQLELARDAGAYAALVPLAYRNQLASLGLPLLVDTKNPHALGKLARDINQDPSGSLAIFAIAGDDDDEIYANVLRLADFLHMLGNPVGIISAEGSSSLQRDLALTYPLTVGDVSHTLAICLEDGATAVVVALNSSTLKKDALQEVHVDVVGMYDVLAVSQDSTHTSNTVSQELGAEAIRQHNKKTANSLTSFYQLQQYYGFLCPERPYCVGHTRESDELALLADRIAGRDMKKRMSLAIAMVLSAGVHRGTIKSALRVSHELG